MDRNFLQLCEEDAEQLASAASTGSWTESFGEDELHYVVVAIRIG